MWEEIVDYFSRYLIPKIREYFGDTVGDIVAEVITFIDKGVCTAKRIISKLWKQFKAIVLSVKTYFEKIGSNEVKIKKESYINKQDGKAYKVISEEVVEWKDLPDEIRAEMLKHNTNIAMTDDMEILEHKFQERAKEMAIELSE
jgi:hypothetical protein